MPKMPDDDVEVLITIDEAARGRVKALASSLKKSGLNVSHVMESSGIVAGTVRRANFAKLERHKGVSAVEVAGEVSIAPPDADVQ